MSQILQSPETPQNLANQGIAKPFNKRSEIDLQFGDDDRKTIYAFVEDNKPVICIAKNLRTWAEDEMLLTPENFAKRVAGILSHETIHIVLDKVIDCKTSTALDSLFGIIVLNDDSVHGLWGLDEEMQAYAEMHHLAGVIDA